MRWGSIMGLENRENITLRDRFDRIYSLASGLAKGKYEGKRSTAKMVLRQQYKALPDKYKKTLDSIRLPKQDSHLEDVLNTFKNLYEMEKVGQNEGYKQPEDLMKRYNKRNGAGMIVVEDENKEWFNHLKSGDEPIYLNGRRKRNNN